MATDIKSMNIKNRTYYILNDINIKVFDSNLLKSHELCDGNKNKIETLNGGKEGEYGKDFMKIKFYKVNH